MKRIAIVVVALCVSIPAFADLGKYKDWGTSPQAYFMTKTERDQWAAVKTEADAEAFVNNFVASRGAGFADEVTKRVAVADKYLTYGKMPGSQTLRGKIIILLGPPSSFSVNARAKRSAGEGTVGGDVNMAGAGDKGGGGASLGDMNTAAQRSLMSQTNYRDYDIGYTADKLPAAYAKPFNVAVELDMTTGKERVPDRKAAADLDTLFEMAAAASVKSK